MTNENAKAIASTNDVAPRVIEGFIYVPAIKLYVAKERTLQGMNWGVQQSELYSSNERMCTISEFRTFVNFLRTGYSNRPEAETILNEIYRMAGNWRAEHLDTRFEEDGGSWFVNYHEFASQNLIKPVRETLVPCLMEEKVIQLTDWFANATSQGLPMPKAKRGIELHDLYYWPPKDKAFAWFLAGPDGDLLGCGKLPSTAIPSPGIRAVRRVL